MQKEHSTIAFYVDMIFGLQMKRVVAGYTQEELSFLLGYPPDHVSRIEAFDTEALVFVTDLNRLAIIFDCDLLALTPGYPISQQKIEILTDYDQDSFLNYYIIYRINTLGKNRLLYKMEDSPEILWQTKEWEATKVNLQEFIDQLIIGTYFTNGAEAWDIYNSSHQRLRKRYPPQLLQDVLQNYLLGDEAQLEIRRAENRITYYIKELKLSLWG